MTRVELGTQVPKHMESVNHKENHKEGFSSIMIILV